VAVDNGSRFVSVLSKANAREFQRRQNPVKSNNASVLARGQPTVAETVHLRDTANIRSGVAATATSAKSVLKPVGSAKYKLVLVHNHWKTSFV